MVLSHAPLSYAPLDDDYLELDDMERRKSRSYNWIDDLEEDEAVEEYYGEE